MLLRCGQLADKAAALLDSEQADCNLQYELSFARLAYASAKQPIQYLVLDGILGITGLRGTTATGAGPRRRVRIVFADGDCVTLRERGWPSV
jgi:hypothetical protein